ncbi:MAG: hypothetical protein U5N58_01350 [Actinomycetota bacterium]|nr:hypothetical protein [Actinomycetota bacterium]
MEPLTKEELKLGKKELEGVLILCWVMSIILGLAVISGFSGPPIGMVMNFFRSPHIVNGVAELMQKTILFPSRLVYSALAPGLYIVELIGIYQRKSFAVPLGRAVLVITMVFLFPVGTIVGAILWKRFNSPIAKRYLNYENV